MGLRVRTAWARRKYKHSYSRGLSFAVVLALLLLLLPLAAMLSVRPRLTEYAVNAVQYQATSLMEGAVADCTEDMRELACLQTDASGKVTSLTTNTAAVNALRTKIVQQVYDAIGTLEEERCTTNLGTLLDPQYLSGVGPKLSYGVTALGCVTAQVDSDFTASGINQTIHTVSIHVSADFNIQLLGGIQTVTVSADYPLEETILVGDVPFVVAGGG